MSMADSKNAESNPNFSEIFNYLTLEFEDSLLQIQHFSQEL